MRKNSPGPSSRVGSPSVTVAIGNRWTQCRGSHLSPLAWLLHVDARALMHAAEAAPLQTTLHRSCRLSQATAPIMSTSDFSPDHRALPRIFANPKESQLAEITQLLFQSGSKTALRGETRCSRHELRSDRIADAIEDGIRRSPSMQCGPAS